MPLGIDGGVFHLPEDILNEILIRLPVKSIGKSRCVSKHWNSLLSSPRFIKSHLARSHHKLKNLLLLHNFISLFTCTLSPDIPEITEGNFRKLDSIPLHPYSNLVDHCNGLVLIAEIGLTGQRGHLLMNPTTLEHSRLPESPVLALAPFELPMACVNGFGYDVSSDDYKVVKVFVIGNLDDKRPPDHPRSRTFADIYSVKKKYWRRVDLHWPRGLVVVDCSGVSGVCVNGALHWFCMNPSNLICALDLATEKCYVISSPKYCPDRFIVKKGGSCLGIVCWDKNEARFDIWTMKEYGNTESWTKNVVRPDDMIGLRRHWFWGDAVAIHYPYKLTFYSFNDDKSFSMTIDDDPPLGVLGHTFGGLIFTESLVSPLLL